MKDYRKLRIVFMGTPEFAVSSLDKLVQSGCNIVAVVTAPDKPGGRGMQLQQSAVKKFAVDHSIPVLQPIKLKDPGFIDSLKTFSADVQVVVAFRMLPEIVWNMPAMGTINVHGSLLPQYRGAAPINRAVMNGEKFTGVTTFKLKHEIDTGDILLAEKINIDENETAGELHDRMKEIGAELLLKTIQGIADGTLQETPQLSANSNNELIHAPKIFPENCRIDWSKYIDQVFNHIRGLSPHPAAYTTLENKKLKIFFAKKLHTTPNIPPGQFETDGKTYLRFAAADGYIDITDLQLEGKKRMPVVDFLRGYHFSTTKP
jgi:methionyl-tRNA formyltransferase